MTNLQPAQNSLRSVFFPKRTGLSLIEIVIASVCFLVAVIPIIGIFSVNMENTQVIHCRAITYTQAQEILEQVYSMPFEALPANGEFDLPKAEGTVDLVNDDSETRLVLTLLPSDFNRHLSFHKMNGTTNGEIRVKVTSKSQPKANVEMVRTFFDRGLGGGRK